MAVKIRMPYQLLCYDPNYKNLEDVLDTFSTPSPSDALRLAAKHAKVGGHRQARETAFIVVVDGLQNARDNISESAFQG